MSQATALAAAHLYRQGVHPDLEPAPIPSDWVLEGDPTANGKLLYRSRDAMAMAALWECSRGRFNWFYDVDEMIYILDGSVLIAHGAGEPRVLKTGDTFFFPAGSQARWTVPTYVRKLAFLHAPVSPKLRFVRSLYRFLTRPFRSRSSETARLLAGSQNEPNDGQAKLEPESA